MALIANSFLHLGVRGSSRSGSTAAAVRGGGIGVDAFHNFHCTTTPIPRRMRRMAWSYNDSNAGWRRSSSSDLFANRSRRVSNDQNTQQQQQQQLIRGDPFIDASPLNNIFNRTIVDNGDNNSNNNNNNNRSRQLTSLSTKSSLPTATSLLQRPIRSSTNRKYYSNANRTRAFSSFSSTTTPTIWSVPDKIQIPEDQLSITFSRASGAGGQNVNKVNTKVELRFHVPTASFLPLEVRQRLLVNEANRINNEGYFSISSQEYRTQIQNRKHVMKKLEDILKESWARPKERKLREGLSKESKENRREMKKKISGKKESRKRVDF